MIVVFKNTLLTKLKTYGLRVDTERVEEVEKYQDIKTKEEVSFAAYIDDKKAAELITDKTPVYKYKAFMAQETKPVKVQNICGKCNTPTLTDIKGNQYFTVDLSDEEIKNLPKSKKLKDYEEIWREDDITFDTGEKDEQGKPVLTQHPWPKVEVAFPSEKDPDRTIMEGIGRIGVAI